MTKTIFSGTTVECLKHFAKTFGNEGRVSMTVFFDRKPNDKTIYRWHNGNLFPNGLNLIKLRYFLEKCGYRVKELEKMEKPIKSFAQLVAYSVITPEEAQRILGYGEVQTAYGILLGRGGVIKTRLNSMQEFTRTHAHELEESMARYAFPTLSRGDQDMSQVTSPTQSPSPLAVEPSQPDLAASAQTSTIDHSKQVIDWTLRLRSLAIELPIEVGQNLSLQERQLLRTLIGDNVLVQIKDVITCLMTEEA